MSFSIVPSSQANAAAVMAARHPVLQTGQLKVSGEPPPRPQSLSICQLQQPLCHFVCDLFIAAPGRKRSIVSERKMS